MKQKLIDALETIGFVDGKTIFLQGTMNPAEEYPSNFVTFWTTSTENISHYDNNVNFVSWNFYLMFYSNDPAEVKTKPLEIANALKAAGFVQQGKGNDILSDEETHTGWAMEFVSAEKQ